MLEDELERRPFEFKTAYLRLKSEIAAQRFVHHLRQFQALLGKAGFNPGQPRNPAGQSDGSQWVGDGTARATPATARGRLTVTIYVRGRPLDASPAQATQLVVAQVRAREAIRQVRELDPTWRPRASASANTVEGEIRTAEFHAREAGIRLMELARGGLGGNNGPPLNEPAPRFGTGSSAPPPFDAINAYRTLTGMPDTALSLATRASQGTVAFGEVDGKYVFGVNSNAPGYTVADQTAAEAMRDRLVQRYPDVMATDNPGHMPNNAVFHAEANALLRAAAANGGTLAGRTVEIRVDRGLCGSCKAVLPKLTMELGNPGVRIVDGAGAVWTMSNGNLTRGGRP